MLAARLLFAIGAEAREALGSFFGLSRSINLMISDEIPTCVPGRSGQSGALSGAASKPLIGSRTLLPHAGIVPIRGHYASAEAVGTG